MLDLYNCLAQVVLFPAYIIYGDFLDFLGLFVHIVAPLKCNFGDLVGYYSNSENNLVAANLPQLELIS